MDEAAMLRLIAETVATETGAARVRPMNRATRAAQVPGWDSLIHARIVMALEDRLGVRIDIARTFDCGDVGVLADYLASLSA
ncbi:MAG: acyl carrier protein [Stellaceae bacterium]